MKDGVMIINTSRGGLLDSNLPPSGLKTSRIGALGLDVYEEEEDLFEDKVQRGDHRRRLPPPVCLPHNVLSPVTGPSGPGRRCTPSRHHHPSATSRPSTARAALDNEVE